MKELKIKSLDGHTIDAYLYEAKQPKGMLLIIHGMQEYAARYKEFAEFLNDKDFSVCISDLRGHGAKIKEGEEGYSEGDIFENIVNDQKLIIKKLKKEYKYPLFVLGHSYGSFITQRLINLNLPIKKFVLSGSAYTNTLLMHTAKIIAKFGYVFKGKKSKAKLIEAMSFGGYSKKFDDGNWLSRDKEVWTKYKNDPYCGVPFPYSFYKSMFVNLTKNYRDIKNADKNVPIFIISGKSDPVGGFGKQTQRLYNFYKKQNLNVLIKLYEDGRHEMLNEINREEVYEDIANFLSK